MILNVVLVFLSIITMWTIWVIHNLPKKVSDYILESRKAEFQKEINKESKLHEERVKLVTEFLIYMNNTLNDIIAKKRDLTKDKEKEKLNKEMTEFGIKLMLFASDKTILKYEEFRSITDGSMQYLKVYGEFVIEIRRDLGYRDTEIQPEDYLKLILKDSKEKIRELING